MNVNLPSVLEGGGGGSFRIAHGPHSGHALATQQMRGYDGWSSFELSDPVHNEFDQARASI